jgi:hypothetical protein
MNDESAWAEKFAAGAVFALELKKTLLKASVAESGTQPAHMVRCGSGFTDLRGLLFMRNSRARPAAELALRHY